MSERKTVFMRIISLVLAAAMIVSSVPFAFAESLISEETHKKSVELANRIESEGIVLLKNEENGNSCSVYL